MKNIKTSISMKKYHRKRKLKQKAKKILFVCMALFWIVYIIQAKSYDTNKAIESILNTKAIIHQKEIKEPVVVPRIDEKEVLSVKETKDKIRAIAIKECSNRNLGEYCINDMLAMAWAETKFKCEMVGDNGNSFGCFQIHRGYHKDVTVEQAKDIEFSINWTLNRMVSKYNYPVYRSTAIRGHNGNPYQEQTLSYLNKVNNYITKEQLSYNY